MRDTHATGTGSIMGAGTAGYCVGNLRMDGATLPHEDPAFVYPDNLAPPLQVSPPWGLVEGSGCKTCWTGPGQVLCMILVGPSRIFGFTQPSGNVSRA
jgi:phosphoribosylformylglycinamidine synthase